MTTSNYMPAQDVKVVDALLIKMNNTHLNVTNEELEHLQQLLTKLVRSGQMEQLQQMIDRIV